MKKFLIFLLAVFLILGGFMGVYILLNRNYYCNPGEKDWYNGTSVPDVTNPFNEIYDGSYTIKIDGDGNVLFKPMDGEEIKGKITLTPGKKYRRAELTIQFENGKSAKGICYINKDKRRLSFEYDSRHYYFTDEQQLSKEEVEAHRAGLIEFLRDIYDGGEFPTQEEIEANSQYISYTNYHKIDPGHGGPTIYDVVKKATIEEVDFDSRIITISMDGEVREFYFGDDIKVAYVNNGIISELTDDDIVVGECLIVNAFVDDDSQGYLGAQSPIYYFGTE